MNTPNDTIVAPATAAGGAIAVVRMSGPSALAICDTVFSGARRAGEAAGYTVLYGTIADGARVLDDVLVTVFRAPHSYTGEDAVEISCHGSRYIVRELLALLVRRGARMATPGEFTSRAFLGGKLDLSQAEAVADLIASGSRAAHTLATDQMRGGYSAELETLRGELLRLASLLELELDFGEEEVEFADRTELRAAMERIGAKIDRLIDSFALGNAIKEGVAVAIVGRPNVGKSTLLNRLLNEERALVSEIPGTTRDPIEATLNLDGILYRFIDTAGLRTTDDTVERMGIERAYASVARAQIVLQVFDAADPAVESLDLRPDQCRILVANKIDRMDPAAAPVSLPDGALPLSAREGRGMENCCWRDCVQPSTPRRSTTAGRSFPTAATTKRCTTPARRSTPPSAVWKRYPPTCSAKRSGKRSSIWAPSPEKSPQTRSSVRFSQSFASESNYLIINKLN